MVWAVAKATRAFMCSLAKRFKYKKGGSVNKAAFELKYPCINIQGTFFIRLAAKYLSEHLFLQASFRNASTTPA